MSAPEANTPALRTLALWDLAEPMARLLLEMDPNDGSNACQKCGLPEQFPSSGPMKPHRDGCPWAPGGLIERIRAAMPEEGGR